MLRKLAYFILFLMAAFELSHAQTTQTWFTLVPASQQSISITAQNLPVGTTYRFWAPYCTSFVPVTLTKITNISDYADGLNGRPPDPCPGIAKEFDILETNSIQNITLLKGTIVSTVSVPAQPIVVVTPPTTTSTIKMKLTCNGNPISVILYNDNSWEISSSAGSCTVVQ